MSFSALIMFVWAVLDSWCTEFGGPKIGSRNSVIGGHGIGCGNVNGELPPESTECRMPMQYHLGLFCGTPWYFVFMICSCNLYCFNDLRCFIIVL